MFPEIDRSFVQPKSAKQRSLLRIVAAGAPAPVANRVIRALFSPAVPAASTGRLPIWQLLPAIGGLNKEGETQFSLAPDVVAAELW